MFGMWDVQDVGRLGYGMLGMWDVLDVGCLGCELLDVGCLLGCGMLVYKMPVLHNEKWCGMPFVSYYAMSFVSYLTMAI